jgi:PAS domain S-box-containing protein
LINTLKNLQTLKFTKIEDLPAEASLEKKMFEMGGIKSLLCVPILARGSLYGFIGFNNVLKEREWSEDDISILKMAAEIFTNALERKRAVMALKVSENQYRNLFEISPVSIAVIDSAGVVVDCNSSTELLTGYKRDELIGTHFTDLLTLKTEDLSDLLIKYEQLLNGNDTEPYELEITQKNGEKRWIAITNSLLSKGNDINGIQVISRDITEKKLFEIDLKHSLKEREILYRELKHRIKNNLQLLSSMVSMTILRTNNKDILNKLQEIQSVIDTMALIYSRAFDSSKLMRLNLTNFINELMDSILKFNVDENLKIDYNIEGKNVIMSTDKAIPLALIANEIIFNSLKHAFNGKDKGQIDISLVEKENMLLMGIKDNGIGIPNNINVEKTDTLGLKLIKNLTEQMNGKIHRSVDNGTEFIIEVPLREGE